MNKRPICLYKRPISFSQAMQYLTRIKLSDEPFGGRNWIMVIRTPQPRPEPDLDELCEELSERLQWNLAREVLRQEREDYRVGQKSTRTIGSWSLIKTRSPVRGAKQRFIEATTFRTWFDMLEAIVRRWPRPWSRRARGAPPKYDAWALATLALLTKLEGGDYAEVVRRARSAGLDCRLDAPCRFSTESAVPCPSYVHKIATQKLSAAYMDQILRHLDQEACQTYEQRLNMTAVTLFAVDSTDIPAVETEWRQANQYPTYTAQRVPFQVTSRLETNTVFNIRLMEYIGQGPLPLGLTHLPSSSTVLADRVYDIEANHQAAEDAQVILHIPSKQRQGKPYRGAARARTRARFDSILYKQRKRGERFFGNLLTRGLIQLHSRSPHTRQIELQLWGIAHNLLALRAQQYYAQAFTLLQAFPPLIHPDSPLNSKLVGGSMN